MSYKWLYQFITRATRSPIRPNIIKHFSLKDQRLRRQRRGGQVWHGPAEDKKRPLRLLNDSFVLSTEQVQWSSLVRYTFLSKGNWPYKLAYLISGYYLILIGTTQKFTKKPKNLLSVAITSGLHCMYVMLHKLLPYISLRGVHLISCSNR